MQVAGVQKVVDPLLAPEEGLALRNLIVVVRETQVFATSVSTSYVATGAPSALVTTASQRTSP